MAAEINFQGPIGWSTQPLQQHKQMMPAEDSSQSGTEETGTTEESQGPEETGYSSFVQELLKDAPKEHVDLMAPYIKKFDAGVTRRFQDLNNKFKPYESLGWDEETTQQMAEVYRLINEEPETLYQAMKEVYEAEQNEAQKPESVLGDQSQAVQGLSPELAQQFTQQQQVLEALANWVIQQDSSTKQAIEDKEYDSYMNLLKTEYGSFDEEYVNSCIANGLDGEAAVKQWQAKEQEIIERLSKATEGLPPVGLSSAGGGAVAQDSPQKLGSIPEKDIRALIANVMGQANQAGQ